MIKKVKRNFVITNMAFILFILITIFVLLFLHTKRELMKESKNVLKFAIETRNTEEAFRLNLDKGQKRSPISKNATFLLRTFVVELDDAGQILRINNEKNLKFTNFDVINGLVSECLTNSQHSGITNNGQFRYLNRFKDGHTRIAFLDRSSEIQTLHTLLRTGTIIFLVALTSFLLISLYLSNRIVQPIEISMKQQQQFVANASHELKTPLTVILANVDIIESHGDQTVESQKKWVNYIREESGRMADLIHNLLYLAKADTQKIESTHQIINFSELLLSNYLPFESVAYEQKKQLDCCIDDNLMILGDSKQLGELSGILLDNAIKYSNPNGSVFVKLSSLNERVTFTVQNTTNHPIEAKQLKRIFERFYRIDEARSRETGGYGLGLSIAESIVRQHRGKITVTSSKEEGTIFKVSFPKI